MPIIVKLFIAHDFKQYFLSSLDKHKWEAGLFTALMKNIFAFKNIVLITAISEQL